MPAEPVIFDDEFEAPRLGANWTVSPGRGRYSLAEKPGCLRYVIDADHTARLAGSGQNYVKAIWLVRSFSGQRWILKTNVTYRLRQGPPTNNRNMHFVVRAPGVNGKVLARADRSVGVNDTNRGSNSMHFAVGKSVKTLYFPNSPRPLPAEQWHFEIERDHNYVAIRAINANRPTVQHVCEYEFPRGTFENRQEIEIQSDS